MHKCALMARHTALYNVKKGDNYPERLPYSEGMQVI